MADPARLDGRKSEPPYDTLLPPMAQSELDAMISNAVGSERERCTNVQVQCPKFGAESDDYLRGFEDGANAVLAVIRDLKD